MEEYELVEEEVLHEDDSMSTPQDYEYQPEHEEPQDDQPEPEHAEEKPEHEPTYEYEPEVEYLTEYEDYKPENEYKNYVWDQEMTFSLIDEYRNHLQDFLHPQGQMIRDVWENISHNMKMRGYDLTPAACDNKWRQLKKTFRYNMPNGGRKTVSKWLYYEALEDILGNKDIARRLVWKQRSTIKREHEVPFSPLEEMIDEETQQRPTSSKQAGLEEPPKWFVKFLSQYQEEEIKRRETLQKMHTDLIALEKQKCILLENLIKKVSKIPKENVPKIVDSVSLSQEVFQDDV